MELQELHLASIIYAKSEQIINSVIKKSKKLQILSPIGGYGSGAVNL